MSEPSEAARIAADAVQAACRVCMFVGEQLAGDQTLTKSDQSPVTVADFASQAVVLHRLKTRLGVEGVVAEESAEMLQGPDQAATRAAIVDAVRVVWPEATQDDVLQAIASGTRRVDPGADYWTLDPIDGTKGFLKGGHYAVCLARVDGDTPTLGVLGSPHLSLDLDDSLDVRARRGSLFVAEDDGPVMCSALESLDWQRAPRPAAACPEPLRVLRSRESAHSRHGEIAAVLQRIGRPVRTVGVDSQTKYAVVTRGQAELYLRIPSDPSRLEPVWDHASGVCLARAAGLAITDLDGKPLDFSKGATLQTNRGVVCTRGDLHHSVLAALQP